MNNTAYIESRPPETTRVNERLPGEWRNIRKFALKLYGPIWSTPELDTSELEKVLKTSTFLERQSRLLEKLKKLLHSQVRQRLRNEEIDSEELGLLVDNMSKGVMFGLMMSTSEKRSIFNEQVRVLLMKEFFPHHQLVSQSGVLTPRGLNPEVQSTKQIEPIPYSELEKKVQVFETLLLSLKTQSSVIGEYLRLRDLGKSTLPEIEKTKVPNKIKLSRLGKLKRLLPLLALTSVVASSTAKQEVPNTAFLAGVYEGAVLSSEAENPLDFGKVEQVQNLVPGSSILSVKEIQNPSGKNKIIVLELDRAVDQQTFSNFTFSGEEIKVENVLNYTYTSLNNSLTNQTLIRLGEKLNIEKMYVFRHPGGYQLIIESKSAEPLSSQDQIINDIIPETISSQDYELPQTSTDRKLYNPELIEIPLPEDQEISKTITDSIGKDPNMSIVFQDGFGVCYISSFTTALNHVLGTEESQRFDTLSFGKFIASSYARNPDYEKTLFDEDLKRLNQLDLESIEVEIEIKKKMISQLTGSEIYDHQKLQQLQIELKILELQKNYLSLQTYLSNLKIRLIRLENVKNLPGHYEDYQKNRIRIDQEITRTQSQIQDIEGRLFIYSESIAYYNTLVLRETSSTLQDNGVSIYESLGVNVERNQIIEELNAKFNPQNKIPAFGQNLPGSENSVVISNIEEITLKLLEEIKTHTSRNSRVILLYHVGEGAKWEKDSEGNYKKIKDASTKHAVTVVGVNVEKKYILVLDTNDGNLDSRYFGSNQEKGTLPTISLVKTKPSGIFKIDLNPINYSAEKIATTIGSIYGVETLSKSFN